MHKGWWKPRQNKFQPIIHDSTHLISPDLLGINIHCRLTFKTKVRYMPLQSENYHDQLVGSQLKLQLSILLN